VHRFGMLRFLCGFEGDGRFVIDLGGFSLTIDTLPHPTRFFFSWNVVVGWFTLLPYFLVYPGMVLVLILDILV